MGLDLGKLQTAAEATGFDATKTVAGAEYKPPAKGRARARLVGYIEIGEHKHKFNNEDKVEFDTVFIFELSGKNHAPEVRDGKTYPVLIEVEVNRSLNVKSRYSKLFSALNYEGKAKSPVHLLDQEYLVEVIHDEFDLRDQPGKKGVKATLYNKALGSFTVTSPFTPDPEDDDKLIKVSAGPRVSPLCALLWENPSMDQWDSIFRDGKTASGKSRNRFQEKVQAALNYQGSPVHQLLQGGSFDAAIEQHQAGTDSANPLDY